MCKAYTRLNKKLYTKFIKHNWNSSKTKKFNFKKYFITYKKIDVEIKMAAETMQE